MFVGICNTMRNKNDKTTEIFGWLEHLKIGGAIFLAKKIRPVIVMIQHQLQNQLGYHWFCSWYHILMITNPIFLAKNMTPRFLRWSSCSNISVILPVLFLMVFLKIKKHQSLAMATLALSNGNWSRPEGSAEASPLTRISYPYTPAEHQTCAHWCHNNENFIFHSYVQAPINGHLSISLQ